MSGQSPDPALTIALARRLAQPAGAAARARAALHVLDWAGCAIAGAASAAAEAMAEALACEGQGLATRVGAEPASPLTAAFYNGALGNVLEMDDVDRRAILHPGPSVIPAALAASQAAGADSRSFLDAVVRGYEAVIRIGRAVGPGHYAYWHNTGTCGPFGAAAAAASAFGLDLDATAHALGLAGTQASGFWQTRHEPHSMAKQLHTARAAHSGLSAAMLARSGFKGPLQVLEGPQGFFAAACPGADPRDVLAHADERWAIFEVSFKPWPACRHAHAAIDAALDARERLNGRFDAIQAIDIATYGDAVKFCDEPSPNTGLEAKFSLQHSVAAALVHGPLQLSHFEPVAYRDPGLRALAEKTRVSVDPRFEDAYPARYGAAVAITLTDGTLIEAQARDALGDPENPLSEDRLVDKARMLAAAGGRDRAAIQRLIEGTKALADGGVMLGFTRALSGQAS